jgi:cysteinyl-tRNA synthetase
MNQNQKLYLFNTLTHQKELFQPLNAPFVGMYVCGPTVYGEPHLGHARSAVTFDILFRYLKHLGYKVRYVRNITDVGHLENDADEGEDKIAKKARIEQLEPMEVAQFYTDAYHFAMDKLHVLRPSIEPRATGHILEQIEMIQKIIQNGFAYVVNGSVYFDVQAYKQKYPYGELSGRKDLEENLDVSRELEGIQEKKHPEDFALWKKAKPEHIMRWNSPWGEGFPGWHIECSAMSTKYLGSPFDIHGGGLDLIFPHHEAEIAQTNACECLHIPLNQAKYWLHCNMVTVNGKKMGKSLGNFITLNEFFSGNHPLLSQAYSPTTIRFFILQAHYRSTLDFSNEALQAAEKALIRLLQGIQKLDAIKYAGSSTFTAKDIEVRFHQAMNDDLNTAKLIAELFGVVDKIHAVELKQETLTSNEAQQLKNLLDYWLKQILGIYPENRSNEQLEEVMKLLIELRNEARAQKNYALSDVIRDKLQAIQITLRDTPDGTIWINGKI